MDAKGWMKEIMKFELCAHKILQQSTYKIYELTLFFNFLIFQLDDGSSSFIGWKVSVRRGNVADAQIVN